MAADEVLRRVSQPHVASFVRATRLTATTESLRATELFVS
jgi:hypothetical protein